MMKRGPSARAAQAEERCSRRGTRWAGPPPVSPEPTGEGEGRRGGGPPAGISRSVRGCETEPAP
eukprot:scaffold4178_cov101-Isochrysis_galbana.AAC.2